MASEATIQLSFLGGASAIGASSTLVQVADTSILIDCGIRFETGNALPDLDQLTGKSLDAIVVTHAHTDHTGALPVVHQAYPGVPIYLTPPTQELVSILQRDALKIMQQEGDVPLYSERQVESMISMLRPVHHGNRIQVRDVEVVYLPASHILGASMVYLATPAGNILFTGDYSVGAQKTVPALDRPHLPVDMIVTETTYGNRLHADRRTSENLLVSRVAQVVEAGGRVLIPAFAIGRAQEVLLILKQALRNKKIPACPIFVDGMVRAVCNVYASHQRYLTRSLSRDISRSGHPFFSEPIVPVLNPQERQDVLTAGACVIVASSGMLSGGPSVFYASELARCEQDAILITGYQDEESPGRALLGLAEQAGPRELRLGNKVVAVRCTFDKYSLSAHADRMQMAGLIEALKPRTVVMVHGDADAKATLAAGLSCKDIVNGDEGFQITRRYPRRKNPLLDLHPEEVLITPEAAAALIGPATGKPLRAAQLSEAWFGKKVGRVIQDRFVQQLEQAGLVRRDDHRRSNLWPLTKRAFKAEASAEELALAETLKQENPKGKLLEFCARRRLPRPKMLETTDEDGGHVIELQMEIAAELVTSGMQRAFSKTVAEQLAAKALLACLSAAEATVAALHVTEAQRQHLEQQNPKGKLLEL
ncbi:MAG: MBL fold metallo-hydrolase, partial [Candidatus Tectomicrobia bacterium]